MRQGRKNRRRLAGRIGAWTDMRDEGMPTPRDKTVRRGDGKPALNFRRPGSQNGRK